MPRAFGICAPTSIFFVSEPHTPVQTVNEEIKLDEQISSHQRIKAASLIERLTKASRACIEASDEVPKYIWASAHRQYMSILFGLEQAVSDENIGRREVERKLEWAEVYLQDFDYHQAREKAAA